MSGDCDSITRIYKNRDFGERPLAPGANGSRLTAEIREATFGQCHAQMAAFSYYSQWVLQLSTSYHSEATFRAF